MMIQIGDFDSLSAFYVTPPASVLLIDPTKNSEPSENVADHFPLVKKVLASVVGLGGFILIVQWLMPERAGKLPLPPNDFNFNSPVVSSGYG